MSTKRKTAIINDIHKLQEGTSTEAAVKIAVSKLLILQRAESSKHEDESFQLYALIDELADKLGEQKRISTEQAKIIATLESTTNQKASEVLLLQEEIKQLSVTYNEELVALEKSLHSLSEHNSMLLTAIDLLNDHIHNMIGKESKLKDYKKFVVSAGAILSETIKNCTPPKSN